MALVLFTAALWLNEAGKWQCRDDQLERRREVRKGRGEKLPGEQTSTSVHLIHHRQGTDAQTHSEQIACNCVIQLIHLQSVHPSLIPSAVIPQISSWTRSRESFTCFAQNALPILHKARFFPATRTTAAPLLSFFFSA